MACVKINRRAHELLDVPITFFRRVSPAVKYSDVGNIGNTGDFTCSDGYVEVFEIKHKTRIEALQRAKDIAAKQHEAAADDRRVPEDIRA